MVLNEGKPGTVVLGRDTRESGPMLEAAVAAGLASAGWRVRLAGVMTSPGVACLTSILGVEAGCVISASHNPAHDNGIKFFSPAGAKLNPEVEGRIEALIPTAAPIPNRPAPGAITPLRDAVQRYSDFLRSTVKGDLAGLRLVVDCANGAASRIAPGLFRSLGAEVICFCDRPDGRNINAGCGATHPGLLAKAVVREGADLGVAFDGDADRAMFVDERGSIRNGDHVLYVISRQRHLAGNLPADAVVGTVMTNLGTERALADAGVRLLRSKVGDREVFALMQESGAVLGGEQSGHIIFLERLNTGDGMLTALQVLAAVRQAQKPLSELSAPVVMFPQLLMNVSLQPGLEWQGESPLAQAIRAAEARLQPDGRVLVRPSGTEPLLRVMLESPQSELMEELADSIQAVLGDVAVKRTFLSVDEN